MIMMIPAKEIDGELWVKASDHSQALKDAVQAERAACAQMLEDAQPLITFCRNDQGGCNICGFTPKLFANSIRERGEL